jgi:hypothetical protein
MLMKRHELLAARRVFRQEHLSLLLVTKMVVSTSHAELKETRSDNEVTEEFENRHGFVVSVSRDASDHSQ